MPTEPPPDIVATFGSLAEIVYTGESYESVSSAICTAAVDLVDGCDHASLLLRRHGRDIRAVGASDDVARRIEALELAAGEGPCIDAVVESQPEQHFAPELEQTEEWPQLVKRILDETPVRGMAGFRINQDDERIGALNIFSDTPGALTEESLRQVSMLVAFAAVALTALHRGEEASTLRRGLESNREIGKAVGLLMALHAIDDSRAFDMLAKVSQEMNIKVAEVAAQVVRHHARGSATGT
jgi:GAF domain-containing protein